MIRQLSVENIEEAYLIIKDVISSMRKQGIDQWDELYPNKTVIMKDIFLNQAVGYFDGDKLLAYMALNDEYAPEYDSIKWNTTGSALIVHRLSVISAKQGNGIARNMMLYAEQYAMKNKYCSLRLDAFVNNSFANRLYMNMGYDKPGIIELRKGLFNCYEKRISTDPDKKTFKDL
jgi:GNAT superfamily N-acetyltransferase